MNKYKIIAFDLDNTLVDDMKARRYAISKVAEYLNIPYTEELGNNYIKFDDQYWRRYQNKELNIPENLTDIEDIVLYVRSNRFVEFFSDISIDYETSVFIYNLYLDSTKECVESTENAKETLQYLKDKYKLIISTNGIKKVVNYKLEKIHVSSYISNIICSEEVGDDKPNSMYYDCLLEKCNCTKDEILFVGDSLTSDVLGGMRNGVDVCWYNPNHVSLPEGYYSTMEIDDLLELTHIL